MKQFILQTLLGSLCLSVNAEQTFLTASDSSLESKVNRIDESMAKLFRSLEVARRVDKRQTGDINNLINKINSNKGN